MNHKIIDGISLSLVSSPPLQSILAKRQELLQARAQVEGTDGGRAEEESKKQAQEDVGDCLLQSVSDMDLLDHGPPASGKPSPHPVSTPQVVSLPQSC